MLPTEKEECTKSKMKAVSLTQTHDLETKLVDSTRSHIL